MTDAEGTGDCYAVALRLVCANPGALLVHGTVVGNGGDVLGVRYPHAWVELDGPAGTICIDRSRGQDINAYRDAYYEAGKVEHATRYTYDEAKVMWTERQTIGPWL